MGRGTSGAGSPDNFTRYAPAGAEPDALLWADPGANRAGCYRHVYHRPDNPRRPWRAKIKIGSAVVNLGYHPTRRAAAWAVLGWYGWAFGDDWRAWVGRLHPENPVYGEAFSLLRTPAGRWRLMVYECGDRREVPPPGGGTYPTRGAAWAAYQAVRRAWGMLAPACLSRRPPLVCGLGGEWRPAVTRRGKGRRDRRRVRADSAGLLVA